MVWKQKGPTPPLAPAWISIPLTHVNLTKWCKLHQYNLKDVDLHSASTVMPYACSLGYIVLSCILWLQISDWLPWGIPLQSGGCGLVDSFTVGQPPSIRSAAQSSDGEWNKLHCNGICHAASATLPCRGATELTGQWKWPVCHGGDVASHPLTVTSASRGVRTIDYKLYFYNPASAYYKALILKMAQNFILKWKVLVIL